MSDSSEIIGHIIDLKTTIAQIDTEVKNLSRVIIGHDGEGGVQKRVQLLELEHTQRRAVMMTLTAVAGALGGLISWIVSHIPRI